MAEDKVTYREGNNIRVLRGILIDDTDDFLVLKRKDGEIQISKSIVLKIERRKMR